MRTNRIGFCEGCHGCKEPCGRNQLSTIRTVVRIRVDEAYREYSENGRVINTYDLEWNLVTIILDTLTLLGIGV